MVGDGGEIPIVERFTSPSPPTTRSTTTAVEAYLIGIGTTGCP
jgi:hypothetical protein